MTTNDWVIRKLDRSDAVESFDSGHAALNRYIARFALTNQSAGSAQTYAAVSDRRVIG